MPGTTTTTTNSGEVLPVLREIQGGKLKRDLSPVTGSIDKEARTVVLSASSEYPVARWFGMEVLDHSESSVDLTRLRGGAPYLLQHNAWSGEIGAVIEAWIEERRLHVKLKLSRSEKAEEIWQDLLDGIRRNVSIGYIPLEMTLERTVGNLEFYRVTRWEPFEVSSVSVPADPTVGLGRSHEVTQNTIIVRGSNMTGTNTPAVDTGTVEIRNQPSITFGTDALAAERQRSADIFSLGQRFNQPELAQEAIQKGYSADQVRGLILERQPNQAPLTQKPLQNEERELPSFVKDVSARALGLSNKEIAQYSLMRAINAAADNDWSKAGLERQVSLALADTLKKESRGFYVPHDLLMRGMSKGDPSKGGALVDTDLRLDEFVDILRNKTVMAKMGMRMLGGLVGDLDLPKKISGSNFAWLGEGQNVDLSDFDLTTLPMSPKTIAGGIPVTRRLRKQAARSIESLIIDDLMDGLGVAIDLGALRGPGTGSQLLGLLNQPGIPMIEFDGPGLTYGKAVDMRTKVASFNAATGALGYLTSVTQSGLAQQTEKFANTGRTVWEEGKVNGYRAEDTNQMPDDTWLFGDFSQVVMGLWGVMDLKVDTSTLAGSDGLVLRVFQDVDAAVRGKSSFCMATKKKAA